MPAIGTALPGGATFREIHPIMEMPHASGRAGARAGIARAPFGAAGGRVPAVSTPGPSRRRVRDRPTPRIAVVAASAIRG